LVGECLSQAVASDQVRSAAGPRSVLEGIPVIVKDNINVARTPTTGGALALEHSVPRTDAPLVKKLREAGAVILAKANLSELANFLTRDMPAGYSSLGGQVLNPYDTAFTPSGSSSGSATAVALALAPVAIGTETDGSVISPSEHQSLVGLKPTVGLISRSGILPIAPSQDTAGPMTISVRDAAAVLAVMAGRDPADPATERADAAAAELGRLELGGPVLAGARLAVVRSVPEGRHRDDRQRCHDAVLGALASAGADSVEVTVERLAEDDETTVLTFEFAPAVDRYLADLGPDAPISSMAELRDWNAAHAADALKFGQIHIDRALAVDHGAERAAYQATRRRDKAAAEAALAGALDEDREAIVFPGTQGTSLAARAGWPSIVLPAGYLDSTRRPVGVTLVSPPWTEPRLLALADALERVHRVRRPPWEINPAVFRALAVG
jgi:amidase